MSSSTSKIGFENAGGSELAKVSAGKKKKKKSQKIALKSFLLLSDAKKVGLMRNGTAPTIVHIHAQAFVLH